MGNIVIVTDSACNLSLDYIKENNIILLPFNIDIKGISYKDIIDLNPEKFYEIIQDKDAIPKTSGVGSYEFERLFRRELEIGNEVLYIGLSSNLTSTYSSAEKARESFDGKKIALVDSKSAAFGQGLLVEEAVDMIKQRLSLRDIKDYLDVLKEKLDYSVMINDIEMLKRSGKILGIQAFAGEVLNIKPIITVDDGKVNILKKIKGTKSAMRFLLKRLNAFEVDERYPIIICYGSDIELRDMMENRLSEFNFNCDIKSMKIGATVGAHTGKSGVGLLFVRK